MDKEQMSSKSFREMLNLPPAGKSGIVTKVPRKQNKCKEKLALEGLVHQYASGWGFTVQKEFFFHPVRRWRFDFYIPELRTAVEYNGLALGHSKGDRVSGHQSVTGHTGNVEKVNQAQIMGFVVLQYTALNYEQFAQDFPLLVASKCQNIIEKK